MQIRSRKQHLTRLLRVAGVGAVLALGGCGGDVAGTEPHEPTVLYDVSHNITDDGVRRARVKADSLTFHETAGIRMFGVEGVLFCTTSPDSMFVSAASASATATGDSLVLLEVTRRRGGGPAASLDSLPLSHGDPCR